MLEDSDFYVKVVVKDSTLNLDNIKMRAFYSVPLVTEFSEPTMIILNAVRINPKEYAPTYPVAGDMYMGSDGHLYVYNGSAWKQLDN